MGESKQAKPRLPGAQENLSSVKGRWQQTIQDLNGHAWWRSAEVEKIGTSSVPKWRVTDGSTDNTEFIMAPITRDLRDKAVLFKLKIDKAEAPINYISVVRLQTEDAQGKKRYWSVKLNTNSGESSLLEKDRAAYGQVSELKGCFTVSVLAIAGADTSVTVRVQIIPASGPSLDENNGSTTGSIVVWDPAFELIPRDDAVALSRYFARA